MLAKPLISSLRHLDLVVMRPARVTHDDTLPDFFSRRQRNSLPLTTSSMDPTLSPPGFNLRTDPGSSVVLEDLRPRHGTAAADSQVPARPASRIPPRFRIPITSASPRQASGPSLQHDPLLQLRNHGQRLTIELQELLDAQSFALMNGSRTGDGSSILLSGSPS